MNAGGCFGPFNRPLPIHGFLEPPFFDLILKLVERRRGDIIILYLSVIQIVWVRKEEQSHKKEMKTEIKGQRENLQVKKEAKRKEILYKEKKRNINPTDEGSLIEGDADEIRIKAE